MPLALSPDDLDHVLALAQPIDPRLRSEFLETVAREIASRQASGGLGEGLVHRIASSVQLRYYRAPQMTDPGFRGPSPTARKPRP